MSQTLDLSFKADDVEEIRDSIMSFESAKIDKHEVKLNENDDNFCTSISFEPSYDVNDVELSYDVDDVEPVKRTKS